MTFICNNKLSYSLRNRTTITTWTRVIPERLRDEHLITKRYTKNAFFYIKKSSAIMVCFCRQYSF